MIPTKKRGVDPKEVTFALPARSVAPSAVVDEMAEAVKQKAQEEKQEEKEMLQMSGHDKREHVARDVSFGDEAAFQEVTLKFAARKFLVVKQMQHKAVQRQKTLA